jgi:hypothetical protein
MNGLLGYSNSLSFATESKDNLVQEAVQLFEERIKEFRPRTIKRTTDKIFYTAGVLRLVLNANLLYPISEGEIKIEKIGATLIINYVIRFYELFALSVIPAVGVLIFVDPIIAKMIVLLLSLLVGYGGNVFITILRYKRFIRNTVKVLLEAKKTVSISEEQKEWIENLNRCDACGHVLSTTDVVCPDCGLSLQ